MLDTIALSLKTSEFKIMNHDAFTPSSKGVLEQPYYPVRRGGFTCKNNPTKKNIERYGYMPRLTLSKRPAVAGFSVLLRVEASLPKLKYGNNFDELTDADFERICELLVLQLKRMGVHTTVKLLQNAEVSAVHYSKNLPLTDYTSCSMVIREISKGSVSRQLTGTKTDYYNDGSAIKFHANSHELIVYDKIKDFERGKISRKRALDSHIQPAQFSLLTDSFKKPFEVLRLEARLGNRRKIKDILSKISMKPELRFKDLYSESVAKEVLLQYWKMIITDMALIVCSGFPSGELYDAIHNSDPKLKPSQILQIIGSLSIIENDGMEGLRTRLERHSTPHSWYNQKKKLNDISITSHMRYNPVRIATQHLHDFVPMRLKDYKKE